MDENNNIHNQNNNDNKQNKQENKDYSLLILILGFLSFIPLIGLIIAIPAFILFAKNKDKNALCIIGLILTIIGLILNVLISSVVVIVAFQSWFVVYQSGINTQVEQQSYAGSALSTQRLEGENNVIVYVANSAVDPIKVNNIKIVKDGKTLCFNEIPKDANPSTVNTFIIDCSDNPLTESTAYDVVLISDKGIFSSTQIAR